MRVTGLLPGHLPDIRYHREKCLRDLRQPNFNQPGDL